MIINSDRRVDWEGYAGISGGIPNSSTKTIYQTISAGASLATVQTAIDNCPDNQVVVLSAGTYSWSNDLDWSGANQGVVLRGAGPDVTTITWSNFTDAAMNIKTSFSEAALSVDANLSQDAVKGEFTITLASVPSWVTVGGIIGIDQLDDTSFVDGDNGQQAGAGYREITGNGSRNMGMFNRVTAKTSTTITLELPLIYGFKTSQTAQIFQPAYDPSTTTPKRNLGIEDMTLKATFSSNSARMVLWQSVDSCYVKNVEFDAPADSGVFCYFGYRCEVRHCYFHGFPITGAGEGYAISLYYWSTGWLVEDNIIDGAHVGLSIDYGSNTNVLAYNYIRAGSSIAGQAPSMNTHGVHCYGNLFEGNYAVEKVLFDYTHGSSSHNTVFRNRVTGNTATGASGDQRSCISIERYNRYNNIVGNILGDGTQGKYLTYNGSTSEGTTGSILVMGGWENISDDYTPSDDYDYTSGMFVLVHGNYDYFQNQQTWEADVSDHDLPTSYFRSSKPSYFGILTWPPFDPANPNTASVTSIPAGYRYINGVDPPAESGGKAKAFNIRNILNVRKIVFSLIIASFLLLV